jgi:hypothetical protein
MGGLSSLFKSKSNTTTLEEMISPEQKRARDLLMLYGQTGATPTGYQAGEAGDLSGFNFGLSPYETSGLASLFDLQGANAPGLTTARDTLTKMANTEFNPEDQSTGLGAFRKALQREVGSASDVLNREAAITGSRFGTAIAGEKRDLAAQQSEQMGSKLAELFTGQQNRALQAAQGLTGLETASAGMEQNRLAQLFNYGSLQRDLQNQQAQMAYNDRQRQRDEQLASFGTMGDIYKQTNRYGLKSMTTKSPSTLMAMWGESNPLVGSYNTHQYGYNTNQTSIADAIKVAIKALSGGVS